MQLVVKRGENDEIGSDMGKIYKNGIYLRNTNNAVPLSNVTEWTFFQNPAKLGITHNQYLNNNPLYNNRSCFSIFRLYNKALDDAEILQNYNFNAYKYNVTSIPGIPYIKDKLICDLDATNRNSYPGVGSIWYDISPVEPTQKPQLPNPTLIAPKGLNLVKKCKKKKQKLDVNKLMGIIKMDERVDFQPDKKVKKVEKVKKVSQEEAKMKIQEETKMQEEVQEDIQKGSQLGQILNNRKDKKVVGIIDSEKRMQMLDIPINKLKNVPVIGYMGNKKQIVQEESVSEENDKQVNVRTNSWLNFD